MPRNSSCTKNKSRIGKGGGNPSQDQASPKKQSWKPDPRRSLPRTLKSLATRAPLATNALVPLSEVHPESFQHLHDDYGVGGLVQQVEKEYPVRSEVVADEDDEQSPFGCRTSYGRRFFFADVFHVVADWFSGRTKVGFVRSSVFVSEKLEWIKKLN